MLSAEQRSRQVAESARSQLAADLGVARAKAEELATTANELRKRLGALEEERALLARRVNELGASLATTEAQRAGLDNLRLQVDIGSNYLEEFVRSIEANTDPRLQQLAHSYYKGILTVMRGERPVFEFEYAGAGRRIQDRHRGRQPRAEPAAEQDRIRPIADQGAAEPAAAPNRGSIALERARSHDARVV